MSNNPSGPPHSGGNPPMPPRPDVPLEVQFPPPPGPPPAYQAQAPGAQSQPPYVPQAGPEKAPASSEAHSEAEDAPPQPPRPQQDSSERPPPQPPRPSPHTAHGAPPQHPASEFADDDPSNPVHYIRDPHRLIGYLVPFPKPNIHGVDPNKIPSRFLIYTPPPPPLQAPPEGEKEARTHKLQRKWQSEVREAKQSDAKLASWKGLKSRATKGISWAMGAVKSADIEFLTRVPGQPKDGDPSNSAEDRHTEDGGEGSDHRTVGLEALDLIYPPSLAQSVPDGEQGLRKEFIETMMRTRSKAQKDAVIATGLLPVSAAIDILATLVWPFGGLLEVDGVWAYSSIRGAKTARSVTKRLASSTHSGNIPGNHEEDTQEKLQLRFLPSSRLELLRGYLAARCAERDLKLFGGASARPSGVPPTEASVLAAIGWKPSQAGGETRNWEDEQWETQEVKEDLKMIMSKAARGWDKWCKNFEKDPEKALKK